ncbi:HDIG domain-containing protein [Actinoplanes oblitus]|uniref:HDIG domain-containing protein n=1 Tax=Actinoplanes oblitus TaxID=3040509 RepID=A0ABY8WL86_9ACTN|nr:HD domain-containing protein [Actinoplanes oblitus]WIM98661.1 HDIG domain-containing protein [Actinoplanes oblitus]
MTAPRLFRTPHQPFRPRVPLAPRSVALAVVPPVAPAGPLTVAARAVAESLIGDLGNRWLHTRGVAERAAELAGPLGVDADLLTAAAWLHDIGYAEPTVVTGFHPLDGADHLTRNGWPVRVAGLVAYHSGARFVAAARGLSDLLAAYPDERTVLADALTYADQTIGPSGLRVDPAARYAEVLLRHGPCSWNARVDPDRGPYLRAIAHRIEHLLALPVAA